MNNKQIIPEEHYCFISYKHRDNDKFVIDSEWADKLVPALARMKIKTPPLEESRIIRPVKNAKDGNYVDRVFKDTYNLNSGEYAKIINKALNRSRKLVLIVSRDMIDDQNAIVAKANSEGANDVFENAWCYREIRDFMCTHTFDDIIPVVVEKQKFDESLIPVPFINTSLLHKGTRLFADKNKNDEYASLVSETERIAYLKSYWTNRGFIMAYADGVKNDLIDVVASRIACSIFDIGSQGENFFLSFRESEKRRIRARRIAAAALIGLLIIIALGFYLHGRFLRSDNLISQSIAANNNGDRQAAEYLALKAVNQGYPLSGKAYSHLRNFINPINSSKLAVLRSWVEFSTDGSKLCLYDSDSDGRFIKVLSSKDFKEESRINYINSTPLRLIPSHDMSYIAVLDWDSLRVYNTTSKQLVKTAFVEAGNDSWLCVYGFSSDDNSFITSRWDEIIDIHLHDNQTDTLTLGGEHRFISDHLYCLEKDGTSFRLYEIHNNPLIAKEIAELKQVYDKYWDYCPATGVCAAITDSGIAIISDHGEQLLTWEGFDCSSVNYLAFSSSGRLACSQGGKLYFPSENISPIPVSGKNISWVSKDEITYVDLLGVTHLLDLSDLHRYSLAFEMSLPHFICYDNFIYNYISPADQVGGYGLNESESGISCIKYPRPFHQDDDNLKEYHYYSHGKKSLSLYDKYIQTNDLNTGEILWSSGSHIWGYNLSSETAALVDELVDINSGNKVADLGWRSKYLGDNHIVTTVSFNPDTVRILSIEDMTTKYKLECCIDNIDFANNRFIVCRCEEEYQIYDILTDTPHIIYDSFHQDRHEYCISDDGRFFIKTIINRETGSIRNHRFYVYDLVSGKLLFCDDLEGALMPMAIANNRTICFIAENKVAFYDIERQRFSNVKNLNFEIFSRPQQLTENIYLIPVEKSGIYKINLNSQSFTKALINSAGNSLSVVAPNYIYSDGSLVNVNTGKVLATGIGTVNRISDGWIYYGQNIEYRIPMLSDRQLYHYCEADYGDRVLTETERTYYTSMAH